MPHKPIAAGKSSFDLVDFATFLSALDPGENALVLDVACGAGNYAIEIARHLAKTGRVHALDLWEEGITRLKLRAGSLSLENIDAEICDVSRKIPLGDASVDICLMATVLHDLVEDGTHEGTLREIIRVLKPHGRLAVVEFKKMPGPPGPPEKVRLSPEELVALLASFGFKPGKTIELGPVIYFSLFSRIDGS